MSFWAAQVVGEPDSPRQPLARSFHWEEGANAPSLHLTLRGTEQLSVAAKPSQTQKHYRA